MRIDEDYEDTVHGIFHISYYSPFHGLVAKFLSPFSMDQSKDDFSKGKEICNVWFSAIQDYRTSYGDLDADVEGSMTLFRPRNM
jgi:hypothetical protein